MNAPKELTILASCPFCGCVAAYYGAAVRCTSFKCNAGLSPNWTTKAVRSVQGDPDERLRQAQSETAERWNRRVPQAALAQEGDEVPEHVGTCEACSKAIVDGEKYASTTDGCSLCFDCAPMLSDVVRQMDEALVNGEAENWFDLSEHELRADRESIAEDIATNGDRKAVH